MSGSIFGQGVELHNICAIMPPMEQPTMCARSMERASKSAIASLAISRSEYGVVKLILSIFAKYNLARLGVPEWKNFVDRPISRFVE